MNKPERWKPRSQIKQSTAIHVNPVQQIQQQTDLLCMNTCMVQGIQWITYLIPITKIKQSKKSSETEETN